MPNDFYNHGSFPTTGSAATSASMRAELDLIAAGFDRMPDLTGTQDRLIVVNSSGTGLTTTNLLKLTPAGFVGIGTGIYSPVTPLHVNANGGEIIRLSVTADAGTQQEPAIGFASRIDDINPAVKISALEFDASDRKASLLFYTRGTDSDVVPTERMRITHDGNVNIGTGTPTNLLSVTGNANITGNTTLGDATTDTVTVNGTMGVGGAGTSNAAVYLTSTALTGTSQYGFYSTPRANSTATSQAASFVAFLRTEAAAFTLTNAYGLSIENVSKGAGSTITNQHGVYINDQTQGTNNYGIASLVSSGANKWNIYASGTAENYFAGNVGIGTTTLTYRFNVGETLVDCNSEFKTSKVDGLTQLLLTNDARTWGIRNNGGLSDSFEIRDVTAATTRMTIDSSGNVGIGTSSPGSFSGTVKLVVGSAATTTTPGAVTVYSGTAAYGGLYFADGTVGDQLYRGAIEYNHPTDALLMYSAGSERMRLDSSGDVGINTTAPNYASWGTALTVNNATTNAGIEIASGRTTNGTAIGGFDFIATANTTNKEVAQISALIVNGGATPTDYGAALRFYTKPDGASLAERMRIDSEGRMDMRSSLTETGSSTASSISATTLTVGGTLTGTFNVGDRLFGPNVEPNTFITALGSGTGGAGTYTVSNSQTVASGTIRAIGGGVNVFRFTDTDTGVNSNQPMGVIEWFGSDASTPGAGVKAYIAGISESLTPDTSLIFGTSDNVASTQAVERMRISSDGRLQINGTNGLATSLVAISNDFPLNTAATAYQFRANAVLGTLNTGAIGFGSSYTLPATGAFSNSYQFFADSLASAGATLTNNFGFYVASQTVGTNIYGFYSNIAAATDRWNFYAGGTAQNYFAGNVGIGTTTPNIYSGSAFKYLTVSDSSTNGYGILTAAGGSGGGGEIDFGNQTIRHAAIASLNGSILGFYTNGTNSGTGITERMRIDSSGNVGIGTTTPVSLLHVNYNSSGMAPRISGSGLARFDLEDLDQADASRPFQYLSSEGGSLVFGNANRSGTNTTASVERMRIDSSGNVGIGTSSPNYLLQLHRAAAASSVLQLTNTASGSGATDGFGLFLRNDLLAEVWQFENGDMRFGTNNAERMRIDSSGNLLVGLNSANANGGILQLSKGITFPATQVAATDANTLDDYEEGTFTPTIVGTVVAGTGTYTTQVGRYTKIGNRVHFSITLTWTAHTGTGSMNVGGLPFTSNSSQSGGYFCAVGVANMTFSGQIAARIDNGTAVGNIYTLSTGITFTAVAMDTAATFLMSGTYEV